MDAHPEPLRQYIAHCRIPRHSSNKEDIGHYTDSLHQRGGPNCNGIHYTAGDLAAVDTARNESHHFLLGEHRTGATDRVSLFC